MTDASPTTPAPAPNDLARRHCLACEGGIPKLEPADADALMPRLASRWKRVAHQGADCLEAIFPFLNFHHGMAFANAVAFLAHREDHHPELVVEYPQVTVRWWTHAVYGLTENDFICAARTDALLDD